MRDLGLFLYHLRCFVELAVTRRGIDVVTGLAVVIGLVVVTEFAVVIGLVVVTEFAVVSEIVEFVKHHVSTEFGVVSGLFGLGGHGGGE